MMKNFYGLANHMKNLIKIIMRMKKDLNFRNLLTASKLK